MFEIIPNSFQTPNLYVDRLMGLLTSDEYKVLVYASRRIFGFCKSSDRISVGQFAHGVKAKNGEQLDYGTGLGEATVRECIHNLRGFGVFVQLAENDPHRNEGPEYGLQLDPKKIDWEGLERRKAEREAKNASRTQKARASRKQPPVVAQKGVCPTAPLLSHNGTPPVVAQKGTPCCRTTDTKHRETQGKTVVAKRTSPVIGEPTPRTPAKPQQPPSQADPSRQYTDLRNQATALYNRCDNAFGRYYGNPPTGTLRRELIDAFEFHLSEGRAITPEHVAEAVRIQQQQDRERGRVGIKRYASAILPTLGEIVVKAFEKQQIEARAEAHHDGTERRLQQRDAYARRLSPEQKAAQQALFQRLRQIQRDTPEWHALSDWEMGIWRTMHGFLSQSHAAAH